MPCNMLPLIHTIDLELQGEWIKNETETETKTLKLLLEQWKCMHRTSQR